MQLLDQEVAPTERQVDLVERRGNGVDYPTMIVAAERATWRPSIGWTLAKGEMKLVTDSNPDFAMSFASMRDKDFVERPTDMMAKPRSPQEMRYRELTRFIGALERSGEKVTAVSAVDSSVMRVAIIAGLRRYPSASLSAVSGRSCSS